MCLSVCVCLLERARERECVRERVCVKVREERRGTCVHVMRECVFVKKRESVCVRDRERVCVC